MASVTSVTKRDIGPKITVAKAKVKEEQARNNQQYLKDTVMQTGYRILETRNQPVDMSLLLVNLVEYGRILFIRITYVKGLYQGATSSLLGVAFESSILFGICSQIKQSLERGLQSGKPQPSVIIPSAAIGGRIISSVLCPSELVKCRTQVLGTNSLVPKSSRYNGPLDCALKTVKIEWESIRNVVFFSTYEFVRYYMHLQLKDASSN
ncbi:hypothetical protein HYC85_019397 [Camellia sinensis]|uniref:Uncharacterized protein n=1 Tax=Camellia sinensis TaxID=4442 RepID=A0A7J7GNC9_CAMSI|nr:hypothetical protein HYC85_019397 [Camellia sinensis]